MNLLVTGGTGFAMSVLGRQWLEAHPMARLVIIDAAPLDSMANAYFAPVADRIELIVADLLDTPTWEAPLHRAGITHIVHGAAITPIGTGSRSAAAPDPEAANPAAVVDVNIMGTVAILEWARRQSTLRRFIYVSSGSVYLDHGPNRPGEPLPEDGYVMPRKLYGISKLASELITDRYGQLFAVPTVSVRPSSVYGPMDRVTASRSFRHVPNRIAHLAVGGSPCVRVNTLDAVGDYIHVEDFAQAIIALLHSPHLHFGTYNIASGVATSVRELVSWAAEKVPGFHLELASADHADVVQDPALRDGMWGAYDISRLKADTGWTPRSVREAFHAYMEWIAGYRAHS